VCSWEPVTVAAAADGESCRPVGSRRRRRVHVQVRFNIPSHNNINI